MKKDQDLSRSSRRNRIAAFMVDCVTIFFLTTAIILSALGPNYWEESDDGKLTHIVLSAMLLGITLYSVKDLVGGISLGKWFYGIMVRDANNKSKVPALGRLVGRNLFLIIWPVEFIVLAINHKKRRLGDTAMNTVVVDNPNKAKKLSRHLAYTGLCSVTFAFFFLFVMAVIKNSPAYKVAVHEISQNEEIIRETGGIEGYGMFPAGSVSFSDGVAHFEIRISGNQKDLKVSADLTKENGKWKLTKLKTMY